MRPRVAFVVLMALAASATGVVAQRPTQHRLFPPGDLGILESPDRDEWQQPDSIMDALLIGEGSRVADLGAGGGWFTIRLARRVGPNGLVYAEDIQSEMLQSIQRRIVDEHLPPGAGWHGTNVVPVLGAPDNPRLPNNLDAVLVVDTYPQFQDPVTLLRYAARALAPRGRLGVIDFKRDGAGGPGPPLEDRVDPSVVRRDAAQAGLKFLGEKLLRYQYVLVFGK
ncbi:MAG: methyltransferase domain-containing protein [Vicinamibacterales bacterium]